MKFGHDCSQQKMHNQPWDATKHQNGQLTTNACEAGYHEVNLDIVWATIIQDLPALSKDLQKLLASESDSE